MRSAALLIALALGALGLDGCQLRRHAPPATPATPHGAAIVVPVGLHYAPAENLEAIDVGLIAGARTTIDMAAYELSDDAVVRALAAAARRGVQIRILCDRGQLEVRPETPELIALQDIPGVTLRVKRSRVYMHLKSYAVDGRVLRTGSANFSASGLKHQDNDLLVLDSVAAAALFTRDFAAAFAEGASE